MERRPLPSAWDELVRTAAAVRTTPALEIAPTAERRRLRRAVRPVAMTAAILTAAGLAVLHLAAGTGRRPAPAAVRIRRCSH